MSQLRTHAITLTGERVVRHPRLTRWATDDPADPGRLPLPTPHVQHLCAAIAPGAPRTDLGGVMSLNVCLGLRQSGSLVLRVHQPDGLVSRPRLLAQQAVRRRLAEQGLRVPVAVPWRGSTVFRCGNRWAELEPYLPNERPAPSTESYTWLYGAMGTLHRALATVEVPVPRPIAATFAPPGSLRRWLPLTEAAVQDDPEAADVAHLVRDCVRHLHRRWVPAAELPVQLIHGDMRLGNVCRTSPGTTGAVGDSGGEGDTMYFDFGFLAARPRVHDLAYTLAFMVWALGHLPAPEHFPWEIVPRLIDAYEATAGSQLTATERRALVPYTAAVPLFYAALDGFTEDPAGKLRTRLPFLRLSQWLLARPDTPWG